MNPGTNLKDWFIQPNRFSYAAFLLVFCAFFTAVSWLANGRAAATSSTLLAGDSCANATVISPSALPFTEDATTEGAGNDIDPTAAGCVLGGGADVVYSFTPAESAIYNLGVTPMVSNFDPSLYIVTDCANPATTCIAGVNAQGAGRGEFLSVNLTAGTRYFIVVDAPTPASGAGAFHFSLRRGSPANDTCASPTIIAPNRLPFSVMGTTIGATNDLNPQTPCLRSHQSGNGPDVIYQFTSADTQNYVITATPIGNFDVTLYVVTDCATATGCSSSDIGGGGTPESLRRNIPAGSTVFIVVDGFDGDAGDFILSVQPTIPKTPDAPTNLHATAVNLNRVDLTWSDNSSNEQGFRIERSLDAQTFTEIATVNAEVTNYTDNTVAAGTLYFYRVFAFNLFGNSDPSNIADVTTPALPPPPQNPVIAVSSTTLDFGTTRVPVTLPITISNTGAVDLQITAITDPVAPFSIVDKPALPLTIQPNQSRQLNVRFSSMTALAFTSSLTIFSTDPATPSVTVNLRGQGAAAPVPNLDLTTTLLDFSGGSSSFILEVKNTGDADLLISSIFNPVSPFFISGQPQLPAVFKPGEGFLLTVAFSPLTVGVYQSTITIVSNDPDSLISTIVLRGTSTTTNEQLKFLVPSAVTAVVGSPVTVNVVAVNGGSGSDIHLMMTSSQGTFTDRGNGRGDLVYTPTATGRVILNFRATDSANRLKVAQSVINIIDAANTRNVQILLTPPDTAPNAPTNVLANDQSITPLTAGVGQSQMVEPQVAAGLSAYLIYRSESANVGVSVANLVGVLAANQTIFVDRVPAADATRVFFYIVTALYNTSTESAASNVTSTAPRILNVAFKKKQLNFQAANSNVATGAVLVVNGTEQFPLTKSGDRIIVEKSAISTPGGLTPKKAFKSGAQLQVRNPNGVTSATITLP